MFTFLQAIQDLPLAITSTFLNATPLIATCIIAALGLERVRLHGWLATLIGFVGILLIVRPDASHLQPAMAYALLGTFALAARDVVTRTVSNDIPTTIATLSTTVVVCLSGIVLVVLGGQEQKWLELDHQSTVQLLVAGVIVTTGNLAAIWAFRAAEVSLVSPFRYFAIIWALVAGYILFDDWPDMTAMVGIVLVAGAGLFTVVSRSVLRIC
jgi:drug/metabolite transporter (DMT)-like permease